MRLTSVRSRSSYYFCALCFVWSALGLVVACVRMTIVCFYGGEYYIYPRGYTAKTTATSSGKRPVALRPRLATGLPFSWTNPI
jgi:hypothetical protein